MVVGHPERTLSNTWEGIGSCLVHCLIYFAVIGVVCTCPLLGLSHWSLELLKGGQVEVIGSTGLRWHAGTLACTQ